MTRTDRMLPLARAQALVAANACGLLPRLTNGQHPGQLAAQLGLDPIATERVVTLLRLCRLDTASPAQIAEAETLIDRTEGLERNVWAHLEEFLATGKTLFETVGRPGAYSIVTPRLAELFSADADRLAEELADRPARTVLDVGAGSGVWSLAMAARDSAMSVTALDFAEVLPRFRERATALGLAERVDALAGSYFDVTLPRARFDRVVIANVLHLEPAAMARQLVQRIADALAPGGHMVVCDAFSSGTDEQERELAAYALHLAMRVRGGYPHRHEQVAQWLEAAGARAVRMVVISGQSLRNALVASFD